MTTLLPLLLLALALLLLLRSRRLERRSGLPSTRVSYEDVRQGQRPARPLRSERYRLSGRPDYLLEVDGQTIPVELKPTRRATRPYDGDRMQLAAYCLLVEETTGHPPPYGILRYAEQGWEIPYTPALRAELLALLDEMEQAQRRASVDRSHEQPARCRGCSQRAHCDQRLL